MSYSSEVLSDGPIRYFRLNDTGSTAVDETGTANGTYITQWDRSQPSLIASDSSNSSVHFDTSNTGSMRAKADGRILGGLTNSTFECWLKTSETTFGWYVYCERGGASQDIYRIQIANAAKNVPGFVYRDDAGTLDVIQPVVITGLADGGRHHYVVTKTGTAISFYIDGARIGTGTLTATDTFTETTGIYCNIGRDEADQINGGLKDTYIDEVALYAKALPPDRVLVHYNIGRSTTDTSFFYNWHR